MGERISISSRAGAVFTAYLARPSLAPAPAVIVLHEAFGVNADMRQTCDALAGQGFIAVCPDLFWRQDPGVDLVGNSKADWRHGMALYTAFDRDAGVKDVIDTMKAAAGLNGASGKVGLLGYCLGGLMSFLTAARAKVDAAVAFYGAETDKYLLEGHAISAPMLVHLAEEDEFMTKEAQFAIKAALAEKPNIEVRSYPGCHHAFSRRDSAHYNAAAAVQADSATSAFLRAWLR